MIIVEVSSMRLVAAHMMSRNHALVFANSISTCHHNKFKLVILQGCLCYSSNQRSKKIASTKSAATVLLGFLFGGLAQTCSLLLGSLIILDIQFLLQFLGQLHKNLFDVVTVLCRALHINQVFLSTEFLYFFLMHLPLIHQVRLVTNEKENSILLCISLDLVYPKLTDIFKAKRVSQIEYQKNSLTTSVVCTCYGSEPLLTRSIPDLKFNIFAIDLYGFESEIYSDSSQIVLRELIFYESDKDGRLTHSRASYYDSFVKMIKLFYHIFRINNYKFQGYSCGASSFTPS